MNISERETAEAIISHIKVCLTSLKAVVQAGPHQNFDALAGKQLVVAPPRVLCACVYALN